MQKEVLLEEFGCSAHPYSSARTIRGKDIYCTAPTTRYMCGIHGPVEEINISYDGVQQIHDTCGSPVSMEKGPVCGRKIGFVADQDDWDLARNLGLFD